MFVIKSICLRCQTSLLRDNTLKNMSQIFCKFGHSTSMCFTVCGSLQNPKVAGYSRDSI